MNLSIRTNDQNNTAIDFESAFIMLNSELLKINQSLEIICVGGYVLQLHRFRGTVDVDAFFQSNEVIDEAICKVGDKLGINQPDEIWLNNSVANMNPMPPSEYCEVVHQFSNLTVLSINITYLVGMKLCSGRNRDYRDVAVVIKNTKDEQPLELLFKLGKIGFNIDISVVLDAYEYAYGIEWVRDFYVENEQEIEKLF